MCSTCFNRQLLWSARVVFHWGRGFCSQFAMVGSQLIWLFSIVAGNLLSGHFPLQQTEFVQSATLLPLIIHPTNSELSPSVFLNSNQNQRNHRLTFHSFNVQPPLMQYQQQIQADSSQFNPNQVSETASAYASQFAQQFVAEQAAKALLINPKIDHKNLEKYGQYLDILQKTYGIQLPGELGRKPELAPNYPQSSYSSDTATIYQGGTTFQNYAGITKPAQQIHSAAQYAKADLLPRVQPQVYQSRMPFTSSQTNYATYPGAHIQSQAFVEQTPQQYTQSVPSAYFQQTLYPHASVQSIGNTPQLQSIYSTSAPRSEFSSSSFLRPQPPVNVFSNSVQELQQKLSQFPSGKMNHQVTHSTETKQQVSQPSYPTTTQNGHPAGLQTYIYKGSQQPEHTKNNSTQFPAPYDPSTQRYEVGYGNEVSINSVKDNESSGSVIGGVEQKLQPDVESEFDSYNGYHSSLKVVVPPRPIIQYSTVQPSLRTTRPARPASTYTYSTPPPQSYVQQVKTRPAENVRSTLQALTQQIRRLPAVLYLDSHSKSAKQTENLLREVYGLPLISFYVDKIEQTDIIQKHLEQLTAHKGMPYLFICGTFIGSEQHVENYHKNNQIAQLVEYVCGDEKKKKTKKTTM